MTEKRQGQTPSVNLILERCSSLEVPVKRDCTHGFNLSLNNIPNSFTYLIYVTFNLQLLGFSCIQYIERLCLTYFSDILKLKLSMKNYSNIRHCIQPIKVQYIRRYCRSLMGSFFTLYKLGR